MPMCSHDRCHPHPRPWRSVPALLSITLLAFTLALAPAHHMQMLREHKAPKPEHEHTQVICPRHQAEQSQQTEHQEDSSDPKPAHLVHCLFCLQGQWTLTSSTAPLQRLTSSTPLHLPKTQRLLRTTLDPNIRSRAPPADA